MKTFLNLGRLVFFAAFASTATIPQTTFATPAQQAYLKASNPEAGDRFGNAVAISGDTVAVAAYFEDSNATGINGIQNTNGATDAGAVYVFVRSGSNWTQQAYIKSSNTEAGDNFGWTVALSGDTLAVGAPLEDSNASGVNGEQNTNSASASGAVYVFVRNGTNWTQQAYIKASNTGAGDTFGRALAISGETLVVGAFQEDSSATGVDGNQNNESATSAGAAYVFVRNGTTWSQQAYLKASNTGAGDQFGYSVAVSGDTVVVGAPTEDSSATGINGNQTDESATDAGAAYVFARSGTTWTQQAYLKASNAEAGDQFGNSVAISGDTIVIGAPNEDSNATGINGIQNTNSSVNSGAAYVFVRTGSNWAQQAYVKASNTGPGDLFGAANSVSISGDVMVVGAFNEDSSATGVNGNQNDEGAPNSGAVYAFLRTGTDWTQQAYFKASNTRAGSAYAQPAVVSGDTLAVGSLFESSNGVGVNGTQTNFFTTDAGAAYIYAGLDTGTSPVVSVQTITASSTSVVLNFSGIPGKQYAIQRAVAAGGPWTNLTTITAPAGGQFGYTNSSPPPSKAFYRLQQN